MHTTKKKSVSSHFMFYRVAGRAVNGCVCCSRFSVNINFDRSRVSDKKYIQKTYLSIYFLCGTEYNTAMDMVHLSCQKGWGQWCNYHIGLKCHLRIMYWRVESWFLENVWWRTLHSTVGKFQWWYLIDGTHSNALGWLIKILRKCKILLCENFL